ncbi:hypothetical protein K469DRAFT_689171 [Zopfia rhizophila CBS 207.26]|uniref:Methyltransferase fungal type helix-turn-helix domain-containing protein n=1 Tax=Zopfia rhizophila CBS 207.26 TaxID=1314779 RepID=A0A6A6ETL3_9PEZI|nr:hypothetical protein K469DRAFT_689171 [Zopfia rhizophila CBS 207.26]
MRDSRAISPVEKSQHTSAFPNSFEALAQADAIFDIAAQKSGYLNYWTGVASSYDKILLAYISEGFHALRVDLSNIPSGNVIADITHLPKYDRRFEQLWNILEAQNIVVRGRNKLIHGSTPFDVDDLV